MRKPKDDVIEALGKKVSVQIDQQGLSPAFRALSAIASVALVGLAFVTTLGMIAAVVPGASKQTWGMCFFGIPFFPVLYLHPELTRKAISLVGLGVGILWVLLSPTPIALEASLNSFGRLAIALVLTYLIAHEATSEPASKPGSNPQ